MSQQTPKRPAILTKTFVEQITTPGRYGDGRGGLGLSLLVKKTQSSRWTKTWSQRIRINGTVKNLGLGSYPAITLDMARKQVLRNARRVATGQDIKTKTDP